MAASRAASRAASPIRVDRIDTPHGPLARIIDGTRRYYVRWRKNLQVPRSRAALKAWVTSQDENADYGGAFGSLKFVKAWQWAQRREAAA